MIKNDTIKLLDGLKTNNKQNNDIYIFRVCYTLSAFHVPVFFLLFAIISGSYMNIWDGELLIHETLFMTAKGLISTALESSSPVMKFACGYESKWIVYVVVYWKECVLEFINPAFKPA